MTEQRAETGHTDVVTRTEFGIFDHITREVFSKAEWQTPDDVLAEVHRLGYSVYTLDDVRTCTTTTTVTSTGWEAVMSDPKPSDWTTVWDNGVTYPFVEDENANITGLGHQDKAEFARLINHFDDACNGEPMDPSDHWEADWIIHTWAVLDADRERLLTKLDGERVGPETPGALAITALWGQR